MSTKNSTRSKLLKDVETTTKVDALLEQAETIKKTAAQELKEITQHERKRLRAAQERAKKLEVEKQALQTERKATEEAILKSFQERLKALCTELSVRLYAVPVARTIPDFDYQGQYQGMKTVWSAELDAQVVWPKDEDETNDINTHP